MIVRAPTRRAPAIAASPTPPQPNTATVSSRLHAAGVHRRAEAGHHAAARAGPAASGRAVGIDLRRLARGDQRLLVRTRRSRARARASVPSASVIFWVALWVEKQYHGLPRRHARHSPHTARQLRTTKSPGATLGHVGPDRLDDARGLVAEQVREVVADPALAVVQIGVADAARLHVARAPRPVRDRDDDRLDASPARRQPLRRRPAPRVPSRRRLILEQRQRHRRDGPPVGSVRDARRFRHGPRRSVERSRGRALTPAGCERDRSDRSGRRRAAVRGVRCRAVVAHLEPTFRQPNLDCRVVGTELHGVVDEVGHRALKLPRTTEHDRGSAVVVIARPLRRAARSADRVTIWSNSIFLSGSSSCCSVTSATSSSTRAIELVRFRVEVVENL